MEVKKLESGRSNHDHSARATKPKVVKKKQNRKKTTKKAPVEKAVEPSGVEDNMKIKSRELAVVFNPSRDVIKPYHVDGDSEMYTEEMVEKRKSLKQEQLVIDSINDFIGLYTMDISGYVTRKEYERLQTKVANILRPNIDPHELRDIIEEDWKNDSHGMDKISRQNLFDGLFELCDIWVPTIDPNDYKEFFD